VAQSVEFLTLDLSLGLDLRVVGSGPALCFTKVWSLLKKATTTTTKTYIYNFIKLEKVQFRF